jgi:NAD(P)-dependent dehydrogenase (short-subunit alcohol dehydrogenase family)
MALRDETIMILGGSGLVGHAMARRLLEYGPRTLVLVALTEREVKDAAAALAPYQGDTVVLTEFGDVYLPDELAQLPRGEVTEHDARRRLLLDHIYGDLTDERIARSFLVQLLDKHRPHRLLDSINTATAFAYLDVYASARGLLERQGGADAGTIERHLLTLPMPQLTRHIQIMLEGLKRAGTKSYVKIGTSGTGGMGFNIPYTHSEERPSRTLLTKSAVAGAHTLLLYLMSRTPGAPATLEIKPTAAIGWREIAYGPVQRGGRDIMLVDCPRAVPLDQAFDGSPCWKPLGAALQAVYINMGENGLFANEEFATITALGQMEFITPEEIADYVAMELDGHPTGQDVIAALDASTAGPTYRAGLLRSAAMRRLQQLEQSSDTRSIAFEMLGPPRLSKLLFEAHLWSRVVASVRALAGATPDALVRGATALLEQDAALRAQILSVGIPILSADGASIRRGERVVVPPQPGADPTAAAARGWVDLRPGNAAAWIERARQVLAQAEARAKLRPGSGSDEAWDAMEPDDAIKPWRFATWIFRHEDKGERIKR